MQLSRSTCILVMSVIAVAGCSGAGSGGSRDYVRAVGSSTVYPFATAVAEHVAQSAGNQAAQKSPVVESTGTGAGMRLFCAGLGAGTPDIADASRRMTPSEYQTCGNNGVKQVVEIQVGIDGIAFAEAKQGPGMKLTPADIYKALAAQPFGKPNTARSWNQVNPSLPAIPILVYGPPTTSGTRDALAELILAAGCKTDTAMAELQAKDPAKYKQVCEAIREDGPYVDAGENDNLIVQKIAQNPKAIGIFGFSFLEENEDKLKGIALSGIEPTYETISQFKYPGARPLYIYVKKQHLTAIKGLKEYVMEWTRAWGPDGYLKQKGMVIAPDAVRARNAQVAETMTALDPAVLQSL